MTYAIFSIGSLQFRAEPGVTLRVPLLEADPGSKVTFDRVLLASDGTRVHAGKPELKGAKVTAEVVRHGKEKKLRIYRFARRTGFRRHAGHRQPFTEIKIADVKLKTE
jgi:large subunit ribosomal protein L21